MWTDRQMNRREDPRSRSVEESQALDWRSLQAPLPAPGVFCKLRSLVFDLYWALWTGLFALLIPFLVVFSAKAPAVRRLSRVWARGTLFGLRTIVGLSFRERGRHNIPDEPCLVVANHQSTWETIALLVLIPDVAIVAKKELLKIPVFRWYLHHSQMIPIDRETGASALRKMAEQGRAALANGRSVLIFPEGTRKSTSDRVEFKRGVEFLYAILNARALPVAVNSGRFWGVEQRYKRPGTINVSYLPPISPGEPGTLFTLKAQALLEAEKRVLA
jgi:1-acyl-sn-glycerol-3-phosphate acyltransferase